MQDAILHSLADAYKDTWDSRVKEPISYGDYIKEYALPETSTDKAAKAALKKERNSKINDFITFLKDTNHPYYEKAHDEFTRMNETLTKSDSVVFNSFYTIVNHLTQKGIPFTVLLRTFGEDLPRVTQDINTKLKRTFFTVEGKFKDGKLLVGNTCLENPADQYAFFKSQTSHCALQDNWKDWDRNEELQEFSKKFALDLSDSNTVCVFFDDNINPNPESKKNIVNPVDAKTGKSLSVPALIASGNLVVVDTVKAVLDDHYFVKSVEKLLQKNRNIIN